MAQDDIINYLVKRRGRLVTLPEVAAGLKINKTNVCRAVRKLHERKEIMIVRSRQGPFVRFLIGVK